MLYLPQHLHGSMRITIQPVNPIEDTCDCCTYVASKISNELAELKHKMNEMSNKFNDILAQNEELKKQIEVKAPKILKFISNDDFAKCKILCIENKPDELKIYIDKYHDAVSKDNNNLLNNASIYGHTQCVKLLLTAGANVFAKNDTAIYWAACAGSLDCVKLLFTAGADIHVKDDGAIRYAAWGNHADVFQYLAENNADVLAKDSEVIRDLFILGRQIDVDTKKIVATYLKYGGPIAVDIVNTYLERAIDESRSKLAKIFRECLAMAT